MGHLDRDWVIAGLSSDSNYSEAAQLRLNNRHFRIPASGT